MSTKPDALAAAQRQHWQDTYRAHPDMYGTAPSVPAMHAAHVFAAAGATRVLELAAGHGRDALYFATQGFTVHATDFSDVAVEQLGHNADKQNLAGRVLAMTHDMRTPIPFDDDTIDAAFAHLALCMALSSNEIQATVNEVRRVLKPGGTFIYTARHTGDAHYQAGTPHGDDIYEHGGFSVHFFSRGLVDTLAQGWTLNGIDALEEGDLPRRIWQVTQTKPPT